MFFGSLEAEVTWWEKSASIGPCTIVGGESKLENSRRKLPCIGAFRRHTRMSHVYVGWRGGLEHAPRLLDEFSTMDTPHEHETSGTDKAEPTVLIGPKPPPSHEPDETNTPDEDNNPLPTELPHSAYYSNAARDLEQQLEEPWRRVRPFHKPIHFLPAGTLPSTFTKPVKVSSGTEVASAYLSLVGLGKSTKKKEFPICDVCGLEVKDEKHETTLAHQSALPHSYPPHSLPRSNKGLKILQDSGWDPDARVGLGKRGEGERYPIKVADKKDVLGVGARPGDKVKVEKERRLGPKELRRKEKESQKLKERVRRELNGRTDIEALLGKDMSGEP
jgi:hypothetical protein